MKTNHQRGFVEKITAYVGQGRNGGGWCACRGKHGIARNNRGLKKFFHTRARFRAHMLERELLKTQDVDDLKTLGEPNVFEAQR